HLNMQELMPIVSNWITEVEANKETKPEKMNLRKIKQSEWISLPSDDLRFKFSQKQKSQNFYDVLQSSDLIFDSQTWVQSM
ncbi:transcriptional antiterminator, partial [Acinetobacter baumannii]